MNWPRYKRKQYSQHSDSLTESLCVRGVHDMINEHFTKPRIGLQVSEEQEPRSYTRSASIGKKLKSMA